MPLLRSRFPFQLYLLDLFGSPSISSRYSSSSLHKLALAITYPSTKHHRHFQPYFSSHPSLQRRPASLHLALYLLRTEICGLVHSCTTQVTSFLSGRAFSRLQTALDGLVFSLDLRFPPIFPTRPSLEIELFLFFINVVDLDVTFFALSFN